MGYYIPREDREAILEKMAAECLAPGGRLIIFHQTEVGIYSVQEHMGMTNHPHHYCSADITSALCRMAENRSELNLIVDEEWLPTGFRIDELEAGVIKFFLERDDVSVVEIQAVEQLLSTILDPSQRRALRIAPVGNHSSCSAS